LTIDPDAEFTALVHRQSRFVFRVAYAVLLNSHDAEDVVQETFLKLYRSRGWEQAENERAYLARVAWRVAVYLRPRRSQSSIASAEQREADETPSSQPGPEQTLLSANQDSIIHAMIDALPEELRVPLALSAFEELHSPEIGAILEIPEGTVRTRLQRARQILRQKLSSIQESRYA
jgi:RNA polymerase sigma-70 factor, ECF subfamily